MNFPKIPNMPKPQAISPADAAYKPAIERSVSAGPVDGVVGLSAPKHFDPNNPSVHVDATIHNPTGVGGDLQPRPLGWRFRIRTRRAASSDQG
ncbi:MAG: hypothetical protein IPK50_23585 [Fibrobacterota bacterium]|nr:hypothetical protein [Fibrobacterota bacterium]QQS05217.1 MAG: hypothetical protein IPK50_23585 [Fibrobacterota bacterium]